MRKLYRRLVFALGASVAFHLIAIVIGMGDAIILPVALPVLFALPNLSPHDPQSLLIILGSAVLSYAIVFWTIGTIWSLLAELVGRVRGSNSR